MDVPGEVKIFAKEEFLEVFSDDEETAREVMVSFLRSTAAVLEQILQSRGEADQKALSFNVHKIKGSAANVRAQRLSLAAARLESALANSSAGVPEALFTDLCASFDEFKRYVDPLRL